MLSACEVPLLRVVHSSHPCVFPIASFLRCANEWLNFSVSVGCVGTGSKKKKTHTTTNRLKIRQPAPLCFLHICYRSPLKMSEGGKKYNRCSPMYLVYYSINGQKCLFMCKINVTFKDWMRSLMIKKKQGVSLFMWEWISAEALVQACVPLRSAAAKHTSNQGRRGRSLHVLDPKSTWAANYLFHQHSVLRAFPVWWTRRSAGFQAILASHNVLWCTAVCSQWRALKQRSHELFFPSLLANNLFRSRPTRKWAQSPISSGRLQPDDSAAQ